MRPSILLVILLAVLFFLYIELVWVSALLLLSFFFYVIATVGKKAVKVTWAGAKSQASEIYGQMEENQPSVSTKFAEEFSEEFGKKAGELAWASDKYVWKSKGLAARIGEGAKNIINKFREIME